MIFICLSDLFGQGRHVYTFENLCREDSSIALCDGTTKIFLNARGTMHDVRPELKAFLDYVAGAKPENPFVQDLEEAVRKAKMNRKWRHEYMTLLMRDQENQEIGEERGRKEGRREGIRALIESFRSFAIPDEVIIGQLMQRYQMGREEAEAFVRQVI